MTEEEEKELVNTPLRTISGNLLQNSYYESARNYSDRELIEMKHFLPRVLELVASFEFPCHSMEITFTRLDLDQPEKWDREEIETLRGFSLAYFRKCLTMYPLPKGEQLVEILIMFGIGHFDLKLLLDEWARAGNIESVLHLKDLVLHEVKDNGKGLIKLINPFSTEEVSNIIMDWLDSERIKRIFSDQIANALIPGGNNFDEETVAQLKWTYELISK